MGHCLEHLSERTMIKAIVFSVDDFYRLGDTNARGQYFASNGHAIFPIRLKSGAYMLPTKVIEAIDNESVVQFLRSIEPQRLSEDDIYVPDFG